MKMTTLPHPPVVEREEWLARRKELLAHEKELTQHRDHVNAMRRQLPMVRLQKQYVLEGPEGPKRLSGLFEGRHQLIVYHFMFDPAWEKGCPGCTRLVNSMGDLSMLNERDTTFVVVSRDPLPKLVKYKADQGWSISWFSSFGTDFNYDFHVTQDESVAPLQYNYRDKAELEQRKAGEPWFLKGEVHGLSVFFRMDEEVYHTYSTFARGCELLTDPYSLLDTTPYGRQEDFEVSPPGWPQKPTYG
jgi:predicted dithiol-disulfide oxidoreductase (DUF899 family)